jgi:catechol 2,3-dioxygenase-like lactoylglutathione lyase family enzyme
MMRLARVTVRVADQAEALRFYTEKLGFVKKMDMPMGPTQRWLTVAPPDAGDSGAELVLQPTSWFEGEEAHRHAAEVGHDPTLVFQVDDCRATHAALAQRGVEFSLPPTDRGYGIEADARDLYGNMLVFIQMPAGH